MNQEHRSNRAPDSDRLSAEQGAALRDGLERIEAGESLETVLGRHPEHAAELRPLIAMALALRSLESRPAPADLASRIDDALDAEQLREPSLPAGPRPVDLDRRGIGAATGWLARIVARDGSRRGRIATPSRQPLYFRLAGAALALVLLIFGGAYASADSLPGDRLYGLKLGIERARLMAAPSSAEAELAERFAARRLDEADHLAAEGRSVAPALRALEGLAPWLGEERTETIALALREGRAAPRPAELAGFAEQGEGTTDENQHRPAPARATVVARMESSSALRSPGRSGEVTVLTAEAEPALDPSGLPGGIGATATAEPVEAVQPTVAAPIAPGPAPDPGLQPGEPQPQPQPEPSEPDPGEPEEPEDPEPSEPEDPAPVQPDPSATDAGSPPLDPTPSPPPSVDPARMAVVVGQVYGEGSVGTPPMPLVGALVEFVPQPGAAGGLLPPPARSRTRDDGSFEARIQEGTYRVFFSHEGYRRMEFGERDTGSGSTPGTPITPRAGNAPFDLQRILLLRDPNQPGPGNALEPIATRPPSLGPSLPSATPAPRQPLPVPSPSATGQAVHPPVR